MNRKVILGIGAVVLLVILGGGYFLFAKNKSTTSPSATTQPSATTLGENTVSSTLKNLLSSGSSQSCTFSTSQADAQTAGAVYVAGGKMRGDFTVTVAGKETQTHMIIDGKTSYFWVEGQKTGIKTTLPTGETVAPSASGTPESGGLDINAQVNYSCQPWTANTSLFNLPAGVSFTSFSIPSAAPSGQNPNAAACAACNNLSGDAKTQCLTTLNCK